MDLDNNNNTKNHLTILLVEDNTADIKITLRAFKRAEINTSIHVVQNGQEVLDYLNHREPFTDMANHPRPDVILMDVNMPRLNGIETLQRLKKDPDHCVIPVVILTSSNDNRDITLSYKEGAAGFIQKPIDYDKFCKLIEGFNVYWNHIIKLPEELSK